MNFFHILNRGVEKRKIFMNEENYLRFVHNFYDFNDSDNVILSYYNRRKFSDVGHPKNGHRENNSRKELVDIICWCLMPTHPHIFVQEKIKRGSSKFSQKIFGGYTKHFNEVNVRSGVLFQGGSKIIQVENDAHFIYLPFYILANPLDLFEPGWREIGIKNTKKAFEFLENYRWSSLRDLLGRINFPEITNINLFFELFDTNEKQFKKDFLEWLGSPDEILSYKEIFKDY